jgi:hypothetical protein
MRTLHDDKLLTGIAGELAGEGIEIVESTRYLPDLLPQPGVLTRRAPRRREQDDIRFGFEVAKAVGAFEIGQTVVVKDGLVVAVEAVEGTDGARSVAAADLARRGAVVRQGREARTGSPLRRAGDRARDDSLDERRACDRARDRGRTHPLSSSGSACSQPPTRPGSRSWRSSRTRRAPRGAHRERHSGGRRRRRLPRYLPRREVRAGGGLRARRGRRRRPRPGASAAERLACRAVADYRELIGAIDCASVVVPTVHHRAVGETLLAAGSTA